MVEAPIFVTIEPPRTEYVSTAPSVGEVAAANTALGLARPSIKVSAATAPTETTLTVFIQSYDD
jgi:hypothetical protein